MDEKTSTFKVKTKEETKKKERELTKTRYILIRISVHVVNK